MAAKTETPPPLALTQRYTKTYPDIWDRIDKLRSLTVSGEIPAPWDFELCYCPVAVAMGALESYEGARAKLNGEAGLIAAAAAWRRTKMIYRFDNALALELISMADDIAVPTEILRSLPAPAVYVQFEEPEGENRKIDGFLVHVEDDVNTREKELRIDYLDTSGALALPIFVHLIPNGTVSDGIRRGEKLFRENLRKNPLLAKPELIDAALRTLRASAETAKEALQLILYICAENAEIEENEAQAKIYRKSDRITDRYRELRKWDVGVKTGVILRAAERRERENEKPQSGENRGSYLRLHKNRPHVRRAHWHHFWTGSGDEKKLILRWVSAVIVNAADGESTPVVIPKKP